MSDLIHPRARCETAYIGAGTRVEAFAEVLAGARIGDGCHIGDHVFIEKQVVIGNRVVVRRGVQLWDGVRVGDDVCIGPNATFTNDRLPGSESCRRGSVETLIADHASIGANATILAGITIGHGAVVQAGAVVMQDVPARAILTGNPARITGYTTGVANGQWTRCSAVVTERSGLEFAAPLPGGATFVSLPTASQARGSISAGNFAPDIPFTPQRYQVVCHAPGDVCGGHAHRLCEEFLICIHGTVAVAVDDGFEQREVVLAEPGRGLYLPPLVWTMHYRHSPDVVLLTLASRPGDPDDVIPEYGEFLRLARQRAASGNGSAHELPKQTLTTG